jgi:uncharacterized protein (TIRG00374 family)
VHALSTLHQTISIPLITTALIVKTFGLVLREVRLWLILETPKPRFSSTIYVGLAAGFFHTFLPFRGGDILSIAMLNRYCALSTSKASVAVGICAFFEMLIFGFFLIAILLFTPYWFEILGEKAFSQSLWSTVYLVGTCVIIVALASRLGQKQQEKPESAMKQFIQDLLSDTHKAVAKKNLTIQLTISAVEIALMLFSFVLGLWAIGLTPTAPWGAVCIILAFSAVAAVALPPSYGAGPAAAILFVFTLLGIDSEQALSYAGVWWILSQIPTLITGVPSLWLIKKNT